MSIRAVPLLASLLALHSASGATPIPVKVAFVEALAPRDTTSSERFQKDYDLAIRVGQSLVEKRLASCGYSLETETAFYDASDPLQAKEKAQALEAKGSWLIIGPRRSNHYVLLAQGAPETATVSIMASSSDVAALGGRHVSISPTNAEMAASAALEARQKLKHVKAPRYVAIVSKDCTSCVDFADSFHAKAEKLGMIEQTKLELMGESPDLTQVEEQIKIARPDFILLPNYSAVSSRVMAKLSPIAKNTFFVGGDGWGDSQFGFVHQSAGISEARGFSVRGFPPFRAGLSRFRKADSALKAGLPQSGPALGILKSIDELSTLLCKVHPRSKAEFTHAFETLGPKHLKSPWGVSIYTLKAGNLVFEKSVKGLQKP